MQTIILNVSAPPPPPLNTKQLNITHALHFFPSGIFLFSFLLWKQHVQPFAFTLERFLVPQTSPSHRFILKASSCRHALKGTENKGLLNPSLNNLYTVLEVDWTLSLHVSGKFQDFIQEKMTHNSN